MGLRSGSRVSDGANGACHQLSWDAVEMVHSTRVRWVVVRLEGCGGRRMGVADQRWKLV